MSAASHVVRGESMQARIAAFFSDVVYAPLAPVTLVARAIRGFLRGIPGKSLIRMAD
ncbi:hypothetical protein D3C76_954090 [compost metagenome]